MTASTTTTTSTIRLAVWLWIPNVPANTVMERPSVEPGGSYAAGFLARSVAERRSEEDTAQHVADPEEHENRDRDAGGHEPDHLQEARVVVGFLVHSIEARRVPAFASS